MPQNKSGNGQNNISEITLLKDSEWGVIEGEPCRVIDFDDTISKLGKLMPYASITIECKKVNKIIKGFITHKIDYIHLRKAFRERTIKENEEVIISWSKKHYKLKLMRVFPAFWPKLWVMICQKGAFELITNPNHRPELQDEARFLAEKPIVEWKPEIMK